MFSRRDFLVLAAGALSTTAAGCRRSRSDLPFSGEIVGASHQIGHLLREGKLPPATSERKRTVVIVGGGIAGLSVGWKLAKSGFTDFEILELEPECGGNSRFGENAVSAYPWGAHYIPLPTRESRAVRELLEELGAIEGYSPAGQPIYNERYLCFAPQERLYIHGRWQEGLLPQVGVRHKDSEEYERLHEMIVHYRQLRGSDGRKAFAIPMEFSSRDRKLRDLDRLSFRDYLRQQGFSSAPLHWYANYGCRDDYGCRYTDVSAWAGLHYFASREGAETEREDSTVLTWPEGNGWVVRRLRDKLQPYITTQALAFRIEERGRHLKVDFHNPVESRSTSLLAEDVVLACPQVVAKHLLPTAQPGNFRDAFQYAPWMVANLTLRDFPVQRPGAPLAWDNVIYDSDSLGYVVATHQSLCTRQQQTVFTYYYPLTGNPPAQARTRLLENRWRHWADLILRDLSKPHPEIQRLVSRLDVFRWGHAMVRPLPGFLWGEARQKSADSVGAIHFAHSDLSGFSIFEEAQYRGVLAAERVLRKHQVRFMSSL